jgi:hypothetical protein
MLLCDADYIIIVGRGEAFVNESMLIGVPKLVRLLIDSISIANPTPLCHGTNVPRLYVSHTPLKAGGRFSLNA